MELQQPQLINYSLNEACWLLWAMKLLAFCMLFGLFYSFMHLGVTMSIKLAYVHLAGIHSLVLSSEREPWGLRLVLLNIM